ncbi:MAG: WYL domain-containing protein [Prevotella sp.]|nr:WYL domain-containing protein [Prevotella sp.]
MTIYTKFKEYIWLVNTIYHAKAITFAEINERWLKTDMSEGSSLSRTTFHRHRIAIEEMFGLFIECDKKNGNKYYIGNEYVLREDSVQNWMLSTLSVGNMVKESQSLNNRILLENIPSGGEKLKQVIKAMKESKKISITYRRYGGHATRTFNLEPYCVKLFGQRWYLLGRFSDRGLATFSLDRILEIKMSHEKFKFDEDFDAASYFSDYFGVMLDEDSKPEKVLIRAYGYEPYYLRDLPLHHSQREIQSTGEYSDFELRLKITSDFKSKLLSRGEWIEVLEPKSLAEEIVEWHQKAIERYKKR